MNIQSICHFFLIRLNCIGQFSVYIEWIWINVPSVQEEITHLYSKILNKTTYGHTVLGDPEVTANLYCKFAYLYWLGGLLDLQYIFAITSGSPSISEFPSNINTNISFSWRPLTNMWIRPNYGTYAPNLGKSLSSCKTKLRIRISDTKTQLFLCWGSYETDSVPLFEPNWNNQQGFGFGSIKMNAY